MRRLLLILIPCALLVIFLYFTLYFGRFEISIDGNHDPTTTHLYVGDEKLFPQGGGGRIYSGKVRPGEKIISLRGPFLEPDTQVVSVSVFSKSKLSITPSDVSKNQTVNNVVELSPSNRIVSNKSYGVNSDWLFVVTSDTSRDFYRRNYILLYSYDTGSWSVVLEGEKLDPQDAALLTAPNDLKQAVQEIAGD